MAISVHIENGLCCGFGNCAVVCPKVFELDAESNRSKLLRSTATGELAAQVRRAAFECPTQAITIVSHEDSAGN
jgi:ferredoxin